MKTKTATVILETLTGLVALSALFGIFVLIWAIGVDTM